MKTVSGATSARPFCASEIRFFQTRNFEQVTHQADFQRLRAVDWHRDTLDPSRLAVDVMTAVHAQQ